MRIVITLDDDVAAKLRRMARRSGASFKVVVNDAIRRGLLDAKSPATAAFVVRARDLRLDASLSYDNVEDLLDRAEGASRP